MGIYAGITMPDSAWQQMSPADRLKYLSNSGGPTGNFVNSMQQSQQLHPNWNSTNYFDTVLNSLATGSGKIREANVPEAASGIGMMSGDAGQDVANATQQTVQNYGSDPSQDQLTGALQQTVNAGSLPGATPEQKAAADAIIAKQRARTADWNAHLGESLGSVTGTAQAYVPGAGKEWRGVLNYKRANGAYYGGGE